jgi:hypothetical protein
VQVEVRGVGGDAVRQLNPTWGYVSLRQDPEGVGVSETTLPSLDGHDGSVRLDDAELESVSKTESDPVVDVNLPLTLGYASGLGVVDGVDTSREMELSSGLLASGYWGSASGRPLFDTIGRGSNGRQE